MIRFQLDDIYDLHYEVVGSSASIPVLFLHGGPGLGYSESDRRFFDFSRHKVIFYDQRGCGRSQPIGDISNNTTAILIQDIIDLLNHLQIEKVHLFGGSWGSTLALLFAYYHPERVSSMVLRGFFSATNDTVELYTKGKVKITHPNAWKRVLQSIPTAHHHNVPYYIYEEILSDSSLSYDLAREWSRYGLSLSRKSISEDEIDAKMMYYKDARNKILIELHYALNQFFIPEGHIFNIATTIDHPTTIIQGRYDHLCPLHDAELLHSCLINSELIVCDAGHSSAELVIERALREACLEKF